MTAPLFVTIPQLKAQLEIDHSLDDTLLEQKLEAAQAAVLTYLDDAVGDAFEDSLGEWQTGAQTPPQVIEAILQLAGILYRFRDDPDFEGKLQHGYLPFAVTMLLYPLRDPALA